MANVNLRELPDELIRQVKIAAATESKTLKDWVVSAMEFKLGVASESKSGPRSDKREGVQLGGNGRIRPRAKSSTRIGAREPVNHAAEIESKPSGIVVSDNSSTKVDSKRIVPVHSDHDPKSCRIYKCGSCAALNYKDAHRGLS
jgi:hypothetical protein